MLAETGMSVREFVRTTGMFLVEQSKYAIWAVQYDWLQTEMQWDPLKNILILLPLPLILFGVLLAFFIRSFRKPEKVLKPQTVELLEARGKSTRGYLRFWRIEMALVMLFVLAFSVFVAISLTLVSTWTDDPMKGVNGIFMGALIAYGIIISGIAYFGRGVYFGIWKIRFMAITQGGPPNPRSGSGYTM